MKTHLPVRSDMTSHTTWITRIFGTKSEHFSVWLRWEVRKIGSGSIQSFFQQHPRFEEEWNMRDVLSFINSTNRWFARNNMTSNKSHDFVGLCWSMAVKQWEEISVTLVAVGMHQLKAVSCQMQTMPLRSLDSYLPMQCSNLVRRHDQLRTCRLNTTDRKKAVVSFHCVNFPGLVKSSVRLLAVLEIMSNISQPYHKSSPKQWYSVKLISNHWTSYARY